LLHGSPQARFAHGSTGQGGVQGTQIPITHSVAGQTKEPSLHDVQATMRRGQSSLVSHSGTGPEPPVPGELPPLEVPAFDEPANDVPALEVPALDEPANEVPALEAPPAALPPLPFPPLDSPASPASPPSPPFTDEPPQAAPSTTAPNASTSQSRRFTLTSTPHSV
jgi:hypothetical protein